LLTEAQTTPAVTRLPPENPLTSGIPVVKRVTKADLPVSEALASLEEIRTELAKDKDYRLTISWTITKKS
jgi:hypothetical protein